VKQFLIRGIEWMIDSKGTNGLRQPTLYREIANDSDPAVSQEIVARDITVDGDIAVKLPRDQCSFSENADTVLGDPSNAGSINGEA
jgi:hypothetical protein